MRIDRIDNKVFDDPVPTSSPPEGLNLNANDSPNSLSSPFRNPYGNFGNFAGAVSSGANPNKKGLTAAERNNNPFNIKFGSFAAKFGATKENKPALDGGSFATFPTVDAGFAAAKGLLTGKSYRGLTVDQAMKRWSNKGYGGEIYPEIAAMQVGQLSDNQLNELQRRQVVREDRNYAKKLGMLTNLPKYRYGGSLPRMAAGGLVPLNPRSYNTNNQLASGLGRYTTNPALNNVIQQNSISPSTNVDSGMNTGLITAGLGLAGEAVGMLDSNPKKVNQPANIGAGALKGAAAGATMGSVIPGWGTAVGAAAGAVVGGVTAGIKGNKRKKAIEANIRSDQSNYNLLAANRSAEAYRQYQPYQYKFGGSTGIQPTFEVEKDEVIQGTPVLEHGQELAGGLHLVGGKKHSQGGTLGTGEGRVFSNSIYFNGGTPAKQAKRIGNQLKKHEANLSSKDYMKRATAEIMTDKLNQKLDELYTAQEEYKLPTYKYGGSLPKLAKGGDTPEERRIRSIEKYLRDNPYDSASAKRRLQKEIDDLRGRIKPKADVPPIAERRARRNALDDIAWTNDLKPVTIKGQRPRPASVKKTAPVKPAIARTNLSTPSELNPLDMSTANSLSDQLMKRDGTEIFNRINNKPTSPQVAKTARRRSGFDINIDPEIALPLALSTAGYLNSARSINLMNTDVPANMIDSPYYGYTDRSRLARHNLNAMAGTVLNNPNIRAGNRQAVFASAANAMNQINDQENSNRFAYDNDYNARALQINAQNNAILNQSQAQRISNQNMQQGLRDQNFSNFLGNINTTLAEQNARKLDERRFKVVSDSYRRQYGTNFDVTLQ